MALTELFSFGKDLHIFEYNKKGITTDRTITDVQLHQSLITFETAFNAYCTNILKGKSYTERQLADYIFTSYFKSVNQYQEYLKRSLFIAKQYLNDLVLKVNPANIEKYNDSFNTIRIDFEVLISDIEVNLVKSSKKIKLHSWRKHWKDTSDIYSLARSLFHVEDLTNLEDLYFFDLKPYSIFAIRQLIEMYGKDILGYVTVLDSNGSFSKKHLYSAWAFIKEDLNKANPRISVPFDIEIILKIEKWSNRFVHTSFYPDCFIIWKALQMLKPLFTMPSTPIVIYDGTRKHRTFLPEIKIKKYSTLKASYTKHVNKGAKVKGQYKVIWKNIDQVGAYIITR